MLQIRSLEGFSLLEQHRDNPFPYKASGSVHMQKSRANTGQCRSVDRLFGGSNRAILLHQCKPVTRKVPLEMKTKELS